MLVSRREQVWPKLPQSHRGGRTHSGVRLGMPCGVLWKVTGVSPWCNRPCTPQETQLMLTHPHFAALMK